MEIQQIIIFAIVGALVLLVITGGLSAMMDQDADTSILGGGAALGAALGGAAGWLTSDSKMELPSALASVMKGGSDAELKVGLPAF